MTQTREPEGFGQLLAGSLLALAKQLVKGGATPGDSVKLAAAGLIAGAFGTEALVDLGVPLRTVQDWQKRSREALGDVDESNPPIDALNEVLDAMGFPFRVVAR